MAHAKIPSSGQNAPFFGVEKTKIFSINLCPIEYLCACVSMWSNWGAFLGLECAKCAKLNHHPSVDSQRTPGKGAEHESMVG